MPSAADTLPIMTGSSSVRDRYPLSAEGSVELAVLQRSGFDESRHIGAAIVVDEQGNELISAGDAGASIYPRSTMKPFQAIAVRRSGPEFDGAELVLSTASHAGLPRHQDVVEHMLDGFGSDETDLQCPPDFAFDRETARRMPHPTRLAMNCSGKHAAMLAACRHNGWDVRSYLDIEHPLQQAVRATVADYTGEIIDRFGIDGCGAPVFPITLRGLARGIARVTDGHDRDGKAVTEAVLASPWAIDGPGRANTVTIERLGVLAKLGAEGVMVMGVPGRGAVAVKVLDGGGRVGTAVGLRMLVLAGLVEPEAAETVIGAVSEPVLGGGRPVGALVLGSGIGRPGSVSSRRAGASSGLGGA